MTPIIQYGAVPVFVDVTIPQYNIDVTKLEEAYTERTKAVRSHIHWEIHLTSKLLRISVTDMDCGLWRTTAMRLVRNIRLMAE